MQFMRRLRAFPKAFNKKNRYGFITGNACVVLWLACTRLILKKHMNVLGRGLFSDDLSLFQECGVNITSKLVGPYG